MHLAISYYIIIIIISISIIFYYCRKKGAKSKLQETYQSIKIEGAEVISGVYSRAEDNQVIN
jgi:hypothetical protein